MMNLTQTIVFLVTAFPPEVSGSAHFNYARASWFAQQGYKVVVFAPDWQQENADALDTPANLTIERYLSKPWIPYRLTYVPTFSAAKQIDRQIAHYQPDLIVMTDVERYFLLSAWQLPGRSYASANNVPYLAEYHTDVYNFSAAYPGWQWLRTAVRKSKLFNLLYRQFDETICPSLAAQASCQAMGIRNARVVPFFGTDISTYRPSRKSRDRLKPWLPDKAKKHTVIGFLGRLGFEKRVDLLIDAFAQLKRSQPDCSLLIVGNGPNDVVESLKQQAQAVEDVHFTGFLMGDLKADVLASFDLFCSPSPYETFGLTVVEAMASGVPVVTVESGAVAEYLVDTVNAYLVAPDDSGALAVKLEQALQADNTALVQSALEEASRYSVERGCQNLRDRYQKLLSRRIKKAKRVPSPYPPSSSKTLEDAGT